MDSKEIEDEVKNFVETLDQYVYLMLERDKVYHNDVNKIEDFDNKIGDSKRELIACLVDLLTQQTR